MDLFGRVALLWTAWINKIVDNLAMTRQSATANFATYVVRFHASSLRDDACIQLIDSPVLDRLILCKSIDAL